MQQLRESIEKLTMQNQILSPPMSSGAVPKQQQSNFSLIQQSLRNAGVTPMGDNNSNPTPKNFDLNIASAVPSNEQVHFPNSSTSRQKLNIPPLTQSSLSSSFPGVNTSASGAQSNSHQITTSTQSNCQFPASLQQPMQYTSAASQPIMHTHMQYTPATRQQPGQAHDVNRVNQASTNMYVAPTAPVQYPQATQSAALHKLGKFPEFYKHNAKIWLQMLEAQFREANITSQEEKQFYLITKLGHDVSLELKDALDNLSPVNGYDRLKETITYKYVEKDTSKLKRLSEGLSGMQNRTPSEYFNYLISASSKWIPRESILQIWKQNLPPVISSGLPLQLTLENEAENIHKADELYDSYNIKSQSQPSFNFSLAPIHAPAKANFEEPNDFGKIFQALNKLDAKITKLESKPEPVRFSQHKENSENKNNQKQSQNKKSAQTPNNRNGLCYFHSRYGEAARNCKDPCNFSQSTAVNSSAKN
uniref:DUF7041 domain-containing protein n=1 Tax=Trichogramma kaykai TaxID=54128 RepID=A0ABD2XRP0_9HYME